MKQEEQQEIDQALENSCSIQLAPGSCLGQDGVMAFRGTQHLVMMQVFSKQHQNMIPDASFL